MLLQLITSTLGNRLGIYFIRIIIVVIRRLGCTTFGFGTWTFSSSKTCPCLWFCQAVLRQVHQMTLCKSWRNFAICRDKYSAFLTVLTDDAIHGLYTHHLVRPNCEKDAVHDYLIAIIVNTLIIGRLVFTQQPMCSNWWSERIPILRHQNALVNRSYVRLPIWRKPVMRE